MNMKGSSLQSSLHHQNKCNNYPMVEDIHFPRHPCFLLNSHLPNMTGHQHHDPILFRRIVSSSTPRNGNQVMGNHSAACQEATSGTINENLDNNDNNNNDKKDYNNYNIIRKWKIIQLPVKREARSLPHSHLWSDSP